MFQLKQFRGDRATENVPICIHERNEIHQQLSEDKYSKTLQQIHFKCNSQKLISSRLEAVPISEGICPVNWFHFHSPFHHSPTPFQPESIYLCKTRKWTKKLILALDVINNHCIDSRKSNTVNAFALPISEGNIPSKTFKPVVYRHDAILVCEK